MVTTEIEQLLYQVLAKYFACIISLFKQLLFARHWEYKEDQDPAVVVWTLYLRGEKNSTDKNCQHTTLNAWSVFSVTLDLEGGALPSVKNVR